MSDYAPIAEVFAASQLS